MMGLKIVHIGPEAFPGLIAAFKGLEFGHGFFRRGGIIPKIRLPGFRFDPGYALFKGSVFKDASRYRRFGFLIPGWGLLILTTTSLLLVWRRKILRTAWAAGRRAPDSGPALTGLPEGRFFGLCSPGRVLGPGRTGPGLRGRPEKDRRGLGIYSLGHHAPPLFFPEAGQGQGAFHGKLENPQPVKGIGGPVQILF
jgi:hypothetical protein